jgi:hypothetical protein
MATIQIIIIINIMFSIININIISPYHHCLNSRQSHRLQPLQLRIKITITTLVTIIIAQSPPYFAHLRPRLRLSPTPVCPLWRPLPPLLSP